MKKVLITLLILSNCPVNAFDYKNKIKFPLSCTLTKQFDLNTDSKITNENKNSYTIEKSRINSSMILFKTTFQTESSGELSFVEMSDTIADNPVKKSIKVYFHEKYTTLEIFPDGKAIVDRGDGQIAFLKCN